MSKITLKNRYNPPFKVGSLDSRPIATRSSTARMIYFHYKKQNFGVASNIRKPFSNAKKTDIYDRHENARDFGIVEDDIDTIKISKNLRNPSGTFEVSLFPTRNFRKLISSGDWIVLFLYSDDNRGYVSSDRKNIVLIGNVDRCSRVREKDEETDKTLLRYRVSGRNFGKVFETTDLWYDPYVNQKDVVDVSLRQAGVPITGSPNELVTKIFDVFLGQGAKLTQGVTNPLGQWKLPSDLISIFQSPTTKETRDFDAILSRKIESGLPGIKVRQMIGPNANGNLWEAMKRGSNSLINELFVDEIRNEDGEVFPTLMLRPRPYNTIFFNSQFGGDSVAKGELQGKYKTLHDLADESFIEISAREVLYDDLGMDDHSRFNMIWMGSRNSTNEVLNHYSNLNKKKGVSLPMHIRESIERYGLRRFEQMMEFCYLPGATSSKSIASNLYKGFMTQVYDFYYANHLYEQGTIVTGGVLEAELGKCFKLLPESDKELTKIFYIEGYEHDWSSIGKWTTTWTLTRGQFFDNGLNVFIDQEADDFGQDDLMIDSKYLIRGRSVR